MQTIINWKRCTCQSHAKKVTVIVPVTMFHELSAKECAFILRYSGHFACFDCGGEVARQDAGCYDHVTGDTVARRLSELGVIK